MTRPALRPLLLIAGGLALASCRLVDQRTFAPAPGPKPTPAQQAAAKPAAAVPAFGNRAALMVIEPGTRLDNYRGVLHDAVAAALRRDPAVRFLVISVVPGGRSLTEQVKATNTAQAESVAVARALIDAGAPQAHVELGAEPDPMAQHPEIRVYVR